MNRTLMKKATFEVFSKDDDENEGTKASGNRPTSLLNSEQTHENSDNSINAKNQTEA